MEKARAKAYRYIIYSGLLDIRGLTWYAWDKKEKWNPFFLFCAVYKIRAKGAIAEWLHNLGQFSANDFVRFDEDWFWKEYDQMKIKYRKYWHADYHKIFESQLSEFKNENQGA